MQQEIDEANARDPLRPLFGQLAAWASQNRQIGELYGELGYLRGHPAACLHFHRLIDEAEQEARNLFAVIEQGIRALAAADPGAGGVE
jgi:hypothetical protein